MLVTLNDSTGKSRCSLAFIRDLTKLFIELVTRRYHRYLQVSFHVLTHLSLYSFHLSIHFTTALQYTHADVAIAVVKHKHVLTH